MCPLKYYKKLISNLMVLCFYVWFSYKIMINVNFYNFIILIKYIFKWKYQENIYFKNSLI